MHGAGQVGAPRIAIKRLVLDTSANVEFSILRKLATPGPRSTRLPSHQGFEPWYLGGGAVGVGP